MPPPPAVCQNGRCEWGEACADAMCSNGGSCPFDCPFLFSSCPFAPSPTNASALLPCAGAGVCQPLSGFCACFAGHTGAACDLCESQFLPLGGTCVSAAAAAQFTCYDGVQDDGERGVDCGGPHCPASRAACPVPPGPPLVFGVHLPTLRLAAVLSSTSLALGTAALCTVLSKAPKRTVAPVPQPRQRSTRALSKHR